VLTPLTGWLCELRPNTEGTVENAFNETIQWSNGSVFVFNSHDFAAPPAIGIYDVAGVETLPPYVRSNSTPFGCPFSYRHPPSNCIRSLLN
jgi:hypothetical protein